MRLPDFLYRMEPIGPVLRAIEGGEAALTAQCGEKNDQLSVRTAEDGLSLWEHDYALPNGRGEDVENRRSRICTVLLGVQTMTVSALEQMAVTLGGADRGAVEEDFPRYHVTLTAIYEGRTPSGNGALREAVERLRPAHLTVEVRCVMELRGALNRYHALSGKVFLTLSGQRTT